MKIFNAMSSTPVKFFFYALQILIKHEHCRRTLIAEGIMTASEVQQFIAAHNKDTPVHVRRRWLNQIVTSLEEFDKRTANIDTLNSILERIEFVDTVLENEQ